MGIGWTYADPYLWRTVGVGFLVGGKSYKLSRDILFYRPSNSDDLLFILDSMVGDAIRDAGDYGAKKGRSR